jgi:hypothetical protein
MCQLSTDSDIQKFLSRIHLINLIRFFISVEYDESRSGGVVFKRGNIANMRIVDIIATKKKHFYKINVN